MFKIRMKVGGNEWPFTPKLARHSEAEVVEVDDDNNVVRLVDKSEWIKWTEAPVAEAPKKSAPPKKKAAKKKAAPKPAIPDDVSLENIDVSAL